MKKKKIYIGALLFLILLGAFVVRLYKFNSPVADWHSWRQSDTSSVSRNFVKYGFDILHPRFDDLSSSVSLLDNPYGYRFVEFPIYNIVQAGLHTINNRFTLEQWGRIISITASLFGLIFLFLLIKKHTSTRAGLIAAFLYGFIPYNIYYSRTLLPDPFMVALFLGGLYFYDLWIESQEENKGWTTLIDMRLFLAVVFTSMAFLIKPYIVFFLGSFIYLIWMKFKFSGINRPQFWIFFITILIPLLVWRYWMLYYPEGVPRNDWLFNGNDIRFKGAFFWWIFAERISHLILGYWGLPLFVLGLMAKPLKREGNFYYTFAIGAVLYLVILATGNVQHDYYQILIVPTLIIFMAKGVEFILTVPKEYLNRYMAICVVLIATGFMLMFAWYDIRAFYNINHPEIVEAGQAVDELTPKDSKVIAVYNGDTTFLYQTNRQGWPVFERSLKEFRKAGATHIVFANPGESELNFKNLFESVKITRSYAIFDLTRPLPDGLKELK